MITAFSAPKLDKDEYSRYYRGLERITAQVTVTGASASDVVVWSLVRRDGFGAVGTGELVCNGSSPQTLTAFIDLRTLIDVDGINWTVQGEYELTFTAQDAPSVHVASAPFDVSVVPYAQMRDEYLYGVTGVALEVLAPVVPPRIVTGVAFVRFSEAHEQGPLPLDFVTGSPPTLSWGNGPAVPIDVAAGRQEYVLLDENGLEYAVVEVDPLRLPGGSCVETLVIDHQHFLSQPLVGRFVRRALDFFESEFGVALEPRRSMTPIIWEKRERPYIDQFYPPVPWGETYDRTQWTNIELPLKRVLKIYDLVGYFNQTQVLEFSPSWRLVNEFQGTVEMVPSAGMLGQWTLMNATFAATLLYSQQRLPNFWQYDVAHGLRDLADKRYAVVLEAIARKATIDLLTQAGGAYKAGIAQETVSRDGTSQSITYTQSAMYSVFSHVVIPMQDWMKENRFKLRTRLGGIPFVTI